MPSTRHCADQSLRGSFLALVSFLFLFFFLYLAHFAVFLVVVISFSPVYNPTFVSSYFSVVSVLSLVLSYVAVLLVCPLPLFLVFYGPSPFSFFHVCSFFFFPSSLLLFL